MSPKSCRLFGKGQAPRNARHPVESRKSPKLKGVIFQAVFATWQACLDLPYSSAVTLQSRPVLHRQMAGARVIAADSGMKHARALAVMPELWVGDFDSSGSELLLDYAHVPRQTHPADKDATDGEIAVAAALKLGAREFILIGGLGGPERSCHGPPRLGPSFGPIRPHVFHFQWQRGSLSAHCRGL